MPRQNLQDAYEEQAECPFSLDIPCKNLEIRYSAVTLKCEEMCAVCFENEPYITTNCGHHFCSCITTNLVNYKKECCPSCRQPIQSLTVFDKRCFQALKSVSNALPDYVFMDEPV